MIPKIIHYCWFGRNPLPDLAIKCINSWKKFLPEYEIKEWNEDNFDVNIIPYTKEAYNAKKYAFVSDYARIWILYNYGGLYFDTDVEIIRNINDIILKGSFMGLENNTGSYRLANVNPGLGLGATSGLDIYNHILKLYESTSFLNSNGTFNYTTIVEYTTKLLTSYGLEDKNTIQIIEGIWIYPTDYFCPIDYKTKEYNETINTRTIHHFAASWVPKQPILPSLICKYIGNKFMFILKRIKHYIYKNEL